MSMHSALLAMAEPLPDTPFAVHTLRKVKVICKIKSVITN